MGAGFDHLLHPLTRGDIKQIVVIHRVQGIDHRLFEATSTEQAEQSHRKLGLDVDDIRVKGADIGQTPQVERVCHPISIDLFEGDGGAIENTVPP